MCLTYSRACKSRLDSVSLIIICSKMSWANECVCACVHECEAKYICVLLVGGWKNDCVTHRIAIAILERGCDERCRKGGATAIQ